MIEQFKAMGYPELPPIADGDSRPFWSVVIPVHGKAVYLNDAIQSVLRQRDGRSMEIIVVDSGSTPPVQKLNRWVCREGFSWYRFEDDLGAIRNWNRAISLSRGHWVHLLHEDDYTLNGFYDSLEKVKDFQAGDIPPIGAASTGYEVINGADVVTYKKTSTDKNRVIPRESWLQALGETNHLHCCCVAIARKTYEDVGLYDPTIPFCADWELYKRIACMVPWYSESRLLARYREHPGGGTTGVHIASKFRDITACIDRSRTYYPPDIIEKCTMKALANWFAMGFVEIEQKLPGILPKDFKGEMEIGYGRFERQV